MTPFTPLVGAIRRPARGLLLAAVVGLGALALLALAAVTTTDHAAAASDAHAVSPTVEVAPANGGVSDDQLAVAIVLPLIFGGCLAGVLLWAVANRAKPDEEETKPMAWWRTRAWYGRREDEGS